MRTGQRAAPRTAQQGGFLLGMVIGLLIGLALALGVALYVTKVPLPFINKVPQRTAEQDAAEAEKNRNWDPNAPLSGKPPRAIGNASPAPGVPPGTAPALPSAGTSPGSQRDPAAILSGQGVAGPTGAASTPTTPETFVFYVQAGAYGRTEEAEQQRAKLAMLGFESRITEREQAGRMVYRVRSGPFNRRGDAEAVKERLAGSGVETALVRAAQP